MKPNAITRYAGIVLLLLFTACSAHKVNIEKMSEKQRTTYLTNTAKEVFKKYPEFYKENAIVTIEKRKTIHQETIEEDDDYLNPNSPWYGMHPNQTFYSVNFLDEESDRSAGKEYVEASIYIREDTGKAFQVQLGSMIYAIKE